MVTTYKPKGLARYGQFRRRTVVKAAVASVVPSILSLVPRLSHSAPTARHQAHPYWDLVLHHTSHASSDRQAARDWLLSWIAHTVHDPTKRIPGLALWGPRGSGKSTFHQAIGTLLASDEYIVSGSLFREACRKIPAGAV